MPNADGSVRSALRIHEPEFRGTSLHPGRPRQHARAGPAGPGTTHLLLSAPEHARVPHHRAEGLRQEGAVWTITANGKTERAYASLKPEFILDARGVYRQYTGFDVQGKVEDNKPPVVRVEGALQRTATVGEPLLLTATASDDGIPEPARGRGGPFQGTALGLRVAWHVYRGPGEMVSFDPPAVQGLSGFPQRLALDAGMGAAEASGRRHGFRCA